jgi:hypothetical protein
LESTGKNGRSSKKIGIGVSYNKLRGLKFENPFFFSELENEVLGMKNIFGELDIIVTGNVNARCGYLIPRSLMEEEENDWCKHNSFCGSSRRSEDKVVNEEGKKLISFCKSLNL